jgi:Mor family transcriptional regulator
MDLWDEITPKDFDDDSMALLVEVAGLETAKKIVAALGGDSLYVPKVESIIRLARNRRINKEFTGFNHKALAAKYDLTTRHIRKIIEEQKKTSSIVEKQLTLF